MENPADRLRIAIEPDPYPLDPRTEYDQFGRMVCWHNRYQLGDAHDWRTPQDFLADTPLERTVWCALFLYDHSGLTMATRPFCCPWDSGQVGWIYRERADILREHGRRRFSEKLRRQVFDILEAEVREYDAYLTGDIWTVTAFDLQDNVVDSIGNVIGYDHAQDYAAEMTAER